MLYKEMVDDVKNYDNDLYECVASYLTEDMLIRDVMTVIHSYEHRDMNSWTELPKIIEIDYSTLNKYYFELKLVIRDNKNDYKVTVVYNFADVVAGFACVTEAMYTGYRAIEGGKWIPPYGRK